MRQNKNHILHSDLGKQYITFVKGEGVYVYDEDGKRY